MPSLSLRVALVAALLTCSAVASAQVCDWCNPLWAKAKALKPKEKWASHHPVEAELEYYHRISGLPGATLEVSGDLKDKADCKVTSTETTCRYRPSQEGTVTATVLAGEAAGEVKLEFGKVKEG